jgi:hypothetical protein
LSGTCAKELAVRSSKGTTITAGFMERTSCQGSR